MSDNQEIEYLDFTDIVGIRNESGNPVFYATAGSAGFDIPANANLSVAPGGCAVVPTGLFLDIGDLEVFAEDDPIPELQIRSRSGLAAKHQVVVLNAPGTIDIDYKDEIKIILMNLGKTDFVISVGDRIAQGVFSEAYRPKKITNKADTRNGGFGSTGVKS